MTAEADSSAAMTTEEDTVDKTSSDATDKDGETEESMETWSTTVMNCELWQECDSIAVTSWCWDWWKLIQDSLHLSVLNDISQ